MEPTNPEIDRRDELYTSFMQTDSRKLHTHPEEVFNALGMTSSDVGMWFTQVVRHDLEEALDDLTVHYINHLVDKEMKG